MEWVLPPLLHGVSSSLQVLLLRAMAICSCTSCTPLQRSLGTKRRGPPALGSLGLCAK